MRGWVRTLLGVGLPKATMAARRRRCGMRLVWLLLAPLLVWPRLTRAAAEPDACAAAALAAERSHATPPGLLARIAVVESGRLLAGETQARAWPWTIDVDGRGAFYDSKEAAIAGVQQAIATGGRLIDVGCMQVDLRMHPDAFRSLDDAFDPAINADYAAGFLRRLYAETGDWEVAVGLYHSHTPWLGAAYRDRVAGIGHGVLTGPGGPAYIRVVQQGRVVLATRGSALYRQMGHRRRLAP